MTECPCGTKKQMRDCCGPYISNHSSAPTAEALMRSRYTAFTLSDAAYLQKTGKNDYFDAAAIRKWSTSVIWLGLEILDVAEGTANDETGEVTYMARFLEHGQARTMSEHALFQRVCDEWRYVGPKSAPADSSLLKVGRNDACPCGSKKKFKKCCGKNKTMLCS